jgi:predicted ATPase/DNA-binding winged helix-turn-helix (wHTH) protein
MSEGSIRSSSHSFAFGDFRLEPGNRVLLEGGKALQLGGRALDILTTLVQRSGEVVSKDDLISGIWPDSFVTESNLRVHMSALRRALGDGQAGRRYITNLPGRGYMFVAPVSHAQAGSAPSSQDNAESARHNLPPFLTRIVGRDDIVITISDQLRGRRFVTLIGAGGIGKTTVAVAIAHTLVTTYGDGIGYVDLAPLGDSRLVASALASVLGLPVRSENPTPDLVRFLRDRQMLLLLDNCDHVIDAAAELTEAIFQSAEGVHILATSREPLRAEGEVVYRLPALGLPPRSARITAAEALVFPAVQLFVERAAAGADGFDLTDADAQVVSDICRRLDGMALAIELAAGLVDTLGLRELAVQLGDRFRTLTRGRRTALPRHRTLGATLDWSYEYLPEPERVVLRRFSVFAGAFTADAACAVVSGDGLREQDVVDSLANLVAKSLVVADISDDVVHFRLLDITRAYATAKLADSGELDQVARRHSEYFRLFIEGAEAEPPTAQWRTTMGSQIDNLRAAMDWAASPAGDLAVGLALTIATVPLWVEFSLIAECRRRVEQALEQLDPLSDRGTRQEMQLYATLGLSLMFTKGAVLATSAALTRALAIAQDLQDVDYQSRLLWGLWADRLNNAEFPATLVLARQFRDLATTGADPNDMHIGDRMVGFSLHFLGDQIGAREHIERMLEHYGPPFVGSHIVRFQFDQSVVARFGLARILWLQGFPEQAIRIADDTIEQLLATGHVLTLCNTLIQAACPLALLIGDLPTLSRYIEVLLYHTESNALDVWHACGDAFAGQLLIARGDFDAGTRVLERAINELTAGNYLQYHAPFLAALADGFMRAGRLTNGLAAIDRALTLATRSVADWCMAELLRCKGELILLEFTPNSEMDAEALFLRSLEVARRQGALSWELRTATSLARLRCKQGLAAEARDLLTPVYERFNEGFDTADLLVARRLLDESNEAIGL